MRGRDSDGTDADEERSKAEEEARRILELAKSDLRQMQESSITSSAERRRRKERRKKRREEEKFR